MRLGKPREETTVASNPGGVRLRPLVYATHTFPTPCSASRWVAC